MNHKTALEILDLARWAPSGDNTQPWRFRVVAPDHVEVHGFDTRGHCVYDLDGHPSQISHGALLETLSIAASAHGLRADALRLPSPDEHPVYDVRLVPDDSVAPSPLLPQVLVRSVQRRALSTRPITASEKTALAQAVGRGYALRWLEAPRERARVARLMYANAGLRLTMPEAYRVHRDVIAWGSQFSDDRIPDQALGADAMTVRLMKTVMTSWERVAFFNRYLAGTVAPRLQMDLWPAYACGGHVLIVPAAPPTSIDDFIAGGRAVQRLWLTASALGLQHQPEMTPLIFGRYVAQGRRFTEVQAVQGSAVGLAARFRDVTGVAPESVIWMGRVGAGAHALSRSRRRALQDLLDQPNVRSGPVSVA